MIKDSGEALFHGRDEMTFDYKIILTGDGSPTLALAPVWEHMHALEGAFTETQYIYQPTVGKAFDAVERPVFLSLGLGLAYNELLIAFEALARGQQPERLASYESIASLRENFTDWLDDKPASLAPVYDQIAGLYARKYGRNAAEAKISLRELLAAGKFRLNGAVETAETAPSHAILFDAFSTKTSPQLWTAEFLDAFFAKASAKPCFVSTYACNGGLKRALKKNAFTLDIQKGFGMKRESTFAQR